MACLPELLLHTQRYIRSEQGLLPWVFFPKIGTVGFRDRFL